MIFDATDRENKDEIPDDLFERAQRLARREKTTFRSLIEQGLRRVLKDKEEKPKQLPPLVTVCGEGLADEFKMSRGRKFATKCIEDMARDCS